MAADSPPVAATSPHTEAASHSVLRCWMCDGSGRVQGPYGMIACGDCNGRGSARDRGHARPRYEWTSHHRQIDPESR